MKEANRVNPKMAAYCRVVREMEDKFYGLELNHVLCKYNQAADTLAKAASKCKHVPNGVFTSDQHIPSIRIDDEQPPEPAAAMVMEIDEAPEPNLEDPD